MTQTTPDEPDLTESQRRQVIRDHLSEWRSSLQGSAAEWDLETVKHLVVLNAAGLAGAATLLGGGTTKLAGWGPATLMGYGFGVILAVLNLHLAARSYYEMATELDQRMRDTWNHQQRLDRQIFAALQKGQRINLAGQICGWLSAGLAIASTAILGWRLLIT